MNIFTRTLFRTKQFPNFCSSSSSTNTIKFKISPYCPRYETLEQKSKRKGLPISPDLAIYKPQITTILSISHRICGVVLVGYSTSFGLSGLCCSHEFAHYVTIIEGLELGSVTLTILKYLLAYPFAFHASTGIRHLLWDTGKFLEIKDVYMTGYAAVGASLALAGFLAYL